MIYQSPRLPFKNISGCILMKNPVTIYKAFIRPHLDYGDILYDKLNNETLIKLRKHNMMQH